MDKPTLIALGGAAPREIAAEDREAFTRALETDILARTLWGEARGEGPLGMEAVACVVLNRLALARVRGRYWWGNSIIQICQKPYQFSCWNRSDPNFRKLQGIDARDIHFMTALRIARRGVLGVLRDTVEGATHYHARGIAPFWTEGQAPVAMIGNHIFYRLADD